MPDEIEKSIAERGTMVLDAPNVESEAPTIVTSDAAFPALPPPLEPGFVLFGTYEIVERLGAGGMGDVYRPRHLRLPEFRAIKVMNHSLASNESAVTAERRSGSDRSTSHAPAARSCVRPKGSGTSSTIVPMVSR